MADRSTPELVCVGNITIDEAIDPAGGRVVAAGGDAVYAALAARLSLPRARMLAPIGTDLPDELVEAIALTGTTMGELPLRELRTVANVVTYTRDGARTWSLQHGEEHFDAMSVYPVDVRDDVLTADGILVSAMSLASQLRLQPWLRAATDATLYLDLQEDYVVGHEDELLALLPHCDVFLPSEIEAAALAGTDDMTAAVRAFHRLGAALVVVKRAERGCLVFGEGMDEPVAIPSDTVTAVDPTGAGDAFCGGFAAAHLLTGDPLAAARAGSRAAVAAISGHGIDGLVRAVRSVADEGSRA